jgi:hypothetical protein
MAFPQIARTMPVVSRSGLLLALLACMAPAVLAKDKLPEGTRVVRLEVFPKAVELTQPFAYRQVLVTGVLDNGDQVDLTRTARLEPSADLVRISPTGIVRPLREGNGEIRIAYDQLAASIPVQVAGLSQRYEVSFLRDVMPVLGKLGCNAGTCHGAQQGKNGFKLSLRGYDPLFDHQALTDEIEARRINRAAPDQSLMLLKPSGGVPHVGGVLTQPGEPYYDLLRLWIAEGVRFDPQSPRVVALEAYPKTAVVPLPGMRQQLAVLAHYSDGSSRDVTLEAFVESSNTEVATVDKHGLVTAVRRGEATMLVRYEGAYAASTLFVMGDRSGFAWQEVPEYNWIDTLVYEKLRQIKVQPSDVCTDGEFLRRVYLDLTGLPPEPEVIKAFLADPRPSREKREELVDRLIGSPDYVEHWTNKWADLLQVNRKFLGEAGAKALRDWIRQAIADNLPYDKFVYAILTASGSNLENPPAAYFKILRDAESAMENTTHLFLAIRFNCNKCHDHPFEKWTQDQYYHLAAYFAQLSRKEDPKYKGQKIGGTAVEGAVPLVEIIEDTNSGEVKHERTGQVTPPKFPYAHPDTPTSEGPRRQQLARWLTSKENPYFARSYVNRIWSYLLGVGLIEPVDDIRAGNPPSNPKLLDRLTEEFIKSGFNTQELMRTICKSRTYQHSIKANAWNADDETNYARALPRRLPAEVLYDSIHRVLGAASRLPGLPPGARAAQLLDSNVEVPGGFLELFGKPPRESACECERSNTVMLGPVLALVNGPVISDALRDPNNRLARLVAAEKDDARLVEEIFLMILCRPPTPAELEAGVKAIQGAEPEYQRLLAEYNRRVKELEEYEKTLPGKQAAWEASLKQLTPWQVLEPFEVAAANKDVKLTREADGSFFVSGPNSGPETYTLKFKTKLKNLRALRLEAMADSRLPAGGPGRAGNGNFVLNELKLLVAPADQPEATKVVALHQPQATFSQDGYNVAAAIDGNPDTGWAVAPQFNKTHTAAFAFQEPVSADQEVILTVILEQRYPSKDHNLGRFRIAFTTAEGPIRLQGPPEALAAIFAVPEDQRTAEQKETLRQYFRGQDKELARLQRQVSDFGHPGDPRLVGAQDVAWALLNSPAFLFNH